MAYRVVSWATGHTGRFALRAIIEHPDLELVGLAVHSPAKVGQDAGVLCGLEPVGVEATNDVEALLALHPDCLAYFGDGTVRPVEAAADMIRFLASGVNVVSTSLPQLVYPPTAPAELRDPLIAACEQGRVSFFCNGADPGFASDLVPLALLTLVGRVDAVRIQEIVNYADYEQAEFMRVIMGFGEPLDHSGFMFAPGILTGAWGGVVTLIANQIGVELEELREVNETLAMDRDVETATGVIPAGTTAAIRFEVQGVVGGQPVIVLEHVTRIADDGAPEWSRMAQGGDGYRVLIEGWPDVSCEFTLTGDRAGADGGLIATAARVVNAIPAVCASKPGLLSALDLPLESTRTHGF
jgi:hypothetical protein